VFEEKQSGPEAWLHVSTGVLLFGMMKTFKRTSGKKENWKSRLLSSKKQPTQSIFNMR
jgi:hypothetical protein